jgi:Ca2+-binding RTX toxin-like protein
MAVFAAYNNSRGLRENYGDNADIYNLYAHKWLTQIHVFAGKGDDSLNLYFEGYGQNGLPQQITATDKGVSHGHHVFADGELSTTPIGQNAYSYVDLGSDTFRFDKIDNVKADAVIVGRLDDFDASRDTLYIGQQQIDLTTLPADGMALHGGGWVKIVEWHGGYSDPTQTQQWILIESPEGGHIFYTLEGARIDLGDGTTHVGHASHHQHDVQEPHFLMADQLPDFEVLQGVAFEDPQNFVPEGVTPTHRDGLIINDADRTPNGYFDHVTSNIDNIEETEDSWIGQSAIIYGSGVGDAIAGGLNADVIKARSGMDQVWGGGGHDTIFGGWGDDRLYGNFDNDNLFGGHGADTLFGGAGDDRLSGGRHGDHLSGNRGNDRLSGEAGWDRLDGGAGRDVLAGGDGSDTFVFHTHDGADRITDFNADRTQGNWSGDRIDLSDVSDITSYRDLKTNHISNTANGDLVIHYQGGSIVVEGFSVSDVNWNQSPLGTHDFIF